MGIYATDTAVTDNEIKLAGSGRGIHAEGVVAQANRITGNKVAVESGDGILIVTPAAGGAGSIIADNTVSGSGANGIFVNARGAANAGGVKLSKNQIHGFTTAVQIR